MDASRNAVRMKASDLVPSNSANVEGMFVGPISPIKTSRKTAQVQYFMGSLSDGSKTVRFVSFEPKLRPQIEQAREYLCGLSLSNCAITRNRGDMEVVVSNQSKILDSPKKFKVDQSTLMSGSQAESNMEITSLDMIGDIREVFFTGQTAKYGSYGIIDLHTNKILHIELVQV